MSVTPRPGARPLPRYFVSARHGRIVRAADGAGSGSWQPFGSHHARQVGAPTTACGLAAHDWRMFWELPFPSRFETTCPDCLAVVAPTELRPRQLGKAAGGLR